MWKWGQHDGRVDALDLKCILKIAVVSLSNEGGEY